MAIRINIGCGQTPTEGWCNYDNSWSLRLSKVTRLSRVAGRFGLLSASQRDFISFAKEAGIMWADASTHIPHRDGAVDVVYCSHMLEHLDREGVQAFLKEARRVLRPGGIIRIAVPDIRYHVDNYLTDGDADRFIERTGLTEGRPKTVLQKLTYVIVGDRHHKWMYDGDSLCRLLAALGFEAPRIMGPGATMIPEPGALNLTERVPESVFVEALNP